MSIFFTFSFLFNLLLIPTSYAKDIGVNALSGVDATLQVEDLKSHLSPLLKNARLIGLAESAHGSKDYLRMQDRMIRFLVLNEGVRNIFIEGGVRQLDDISNYVKSCEGDVHQVIKKLYDPSEEYVELLKWLCKYNVEHPQDKVTFQGVDIWERPWEHHAFISNWVFELKIKSLFAPVREIKAHCWGQNISD